jgi:predicted RNA binding protein YcfA (HicA-like mRNA interferase family)
MPELRNVRPRDLAAALERAGGSRRPGKGSHINIKMPNGQIITFSGSRQPIKIGLLKAMIRKAGLTEERLVDLLK